MLMMMVMLVTGMMVLTVMVIMVMVTVMVMLMVMVVIRVMVMVVVFSLTPYTTTEAWRRKWRPTPVFLPGKSHGQRSWQATVQRS